MLIIVIEFLIKYYGIIVANDIIILLKVWIMEPFLTSYIEECT